MLVRLAVVLAVCCAALVSAQRVSRRSAVRTVVSSAPASYNISTVPWQYQINDFDCGAASSQMVLQYWASTAAEFNAMNQNDVMNVARTSPNDGTYTTDILRVGRFSSLSTPSLDWFPSPNPSAGGGGGGGGGAIHGFTNRPNGVSTFGYSSTTDWLDQLKPVLASGYPIIVLMNFDATPVVDGHYRVLTGYDDTKELVYLNDPWGQAPIPSFSYANFSIAWNYTEQMHPNALPYWAAVFVPWTVQLFIGPAGRGSYVVTATITYPAIAPFATSGVDASTVTLNSYARIQLSDELLLVDKEKAQVSTGAMKPGDQLTVSWIIFFNETAVAASGLAFDDWASNQWVHVVSHGIVAGEADRIYCCGESATARTKPKASDVARTRGLSLEERLTAYDTAAAAMEESDNTYYFPAYEYMDAVGGSLNQTMAVLLSRS